MITIRIPPWLRYAVALGLAFGVACCTLCYGFLLLAHVNPGLAMGALLVVQYPRAITAMVRYWRGLERWLP